MSSDSFTEIDNLSSVSSEQESISSERYNCNTLWTIVNFDSTISTVGQDYFSPSFAPSNKVNYRWFIGLSVVQHGEDKHVNIFLKPDFLRSMQGCGGCVFNYMLSVEKANREPIGVWKVDSSTTSEQNRTVHILPHSKAFQDSLPEEKLLLRADITFELFNTNDQASNRARSFSIGSAGRVLGDLSLMLGSKTFSDVVISVDDSGTNHTIPAHQVILAARSAFFREKLTQNTPESRDRCISISGLDISTVRNMLAYVYTDRFNHTLSSDQIIKLLKCAEKYSIEGLKTLCELHLIRSINDTNVFECLIAAESYNAHELKNRALEIICQNGQNIGRMKGALSMSSELSNEQRLSLLMDIVIEVSKKCKPQ